MQFIKFSQDKIQIDALQLKQGESWCFYGANDSAIEPFFNLLAGDDTQSGIMKQAEAVSFNRIQEIFEAELKADDSDFLDHQDPGTLAIDFLPPHTAHHPLVRQLHMENTLQTGFKQLSSGQVRKILLLQAILGRSRQILFHTPYDGLDIESRGELDNALSQVCRLKQTYIFVHNVDDIPEWCTHLGVFVGEELQQSGLRAEVIGTIAEERSQQEINLQGARQSQEMLISLKNGSAGYGDKAVFSGLDLEIKSGQHTLVYGPNGCGKSTLLQLLTGDHPHCYNNDLTIFGRKRGSGESIWQLKSEMGIVSPDLHRNHRRVGTALEVVISGLYDTIGLYQKPSRQERQQAEQWLNWLGLEKMGKSSFSALGFAQQRLVLIARGLIKLPKLLILDEASQGLDGVNRSLFLHILDKIAEEKLCTILFVSHRADEYKDFFQQRINLAEFSESETSAA